MDVDVQPVHEDVPTREDKRRDIDFFFGPAILKIVNGNTKKYCSCKLCPYVSPGPLFLRLLIRMFM